MRIPILLRLYFNIYVQEVRYVAGAWMRTAAGMQEVEQRRSSRRGATMYTLRDGAAPPALLGLVLFCMDITNHSN